MIINTIKVVKVTCSAHLAAGGGSDELVFLFNWFDIDRVVPYVFL